MKKIRNQIVALFLMVCTLLSIMPIYSEAKENHPIEVIQKQESANEIHMKYKMNIGDRRYLFDESLERRDGGILLNSNRVELSTLGIPILLTQSSVQERYKIEELPEETNAIELFSKKKCKVVDKVISFRGTKLGLFAVGAVITAVLGMALPEAAAVALGLVGYINGYLHGVMPDELYFRGERCVTRKVGKIYNDYKGNIYKDKNHTEIVYKDVSWSRRWGGGGIWI